MSGSIASLASTTGASASTSGSSTGSASSSSTNALSSLTDNFSDFLNLLMTQLQNQDPSSPMDTNQFTSELVQFSQVEQQITTNSSLTTLIQATQGSETIQASDVVGQQVTLNSTQLPLQNGTGAINFNTPAAEPISISITNSAGLDVKDVSLTSTAGQNTWAWNGTNNSGATLPDGVYTATVTGGSSSATASAVPFTVTGTATGVTNSNGVVALQLGALTTPFSNVTSVNTAATGSGSSTSGN